MLPCVKSVHAFAIVYTQNANTLCTIAFNRFACDRDRLRAFARRTISNTQAYFGFRNFLDELYCTCTLNHFSAYYFFGLHVHTSTYFFAFYFFIFLFSIFSRVRAKKITSIDIRTQYTVFCPN